MKILSYNIARGGRGREAALAAVIAPASPDVVVLQEAIRPDVVARLAERLGFADYASAPGRSLAFLSRQRVRHYEWHRPRLSRHAFLEIVPDGGALRIFGLHLSAVHSAWTERHRTIELRALLASIAKHQHGPHVLIGDFNTLAPGEMLERRLLPARLRALVWLSGGRIRWRTIQRVLDGGYIDAFRACHPDRPGLTFPSHSPHVRLDYAFVPQRFAGAVKSCDVIEAPDARHASDHLALTFEIDEGEGVRS